MYKTKEHCDHECSLCMLGRSKILSEMQQWRTEVGGGGGRGGREGGEVGRFPIEHPLEPLAEPWVAMGRFCSSFNHKFLRNSCITCILNIIWCVKRKNFKSRLNSPFFNYTRHVSILDLTMRHFHCINMYKHLPNFY